MKLELVPSVIRVDPPRIDLAFLEQHPEVEPHKKKVLEEHDNTCAHCGFRSLSFMEVKHLDGDHRNHAIKNLRPICSICHLVDHVDYAGDAAEAIAIWAPEISQERISHVMRTALMAQRHAEKANAQKAATGVPQAGRARGGQMSPEERREVQQMADNAKVIIESLRNREEKAKTEWGTSSLRDIAMTLRRMSDAEYVNRSAIFVGMRIFPLGRRIVSGVDTMPMRVEKWNEPRETYVSLKPQSWSRILKMADLRG